MSTTLQTPDVATQALEDIDVSRPERFRDDDWQDWFARLRKEDPVHYCPDNSEQDLPSLVGQTSLASRRHETFLGD